LSQLLCLLVLFLPHFTKVVEAVVIQWLAIAALSFIIM
jgi:hypothetical protein